MAKRKNLNVKNKSLRVQEIYDFLCQFAPPPLAETWDNIGLQVGNLSDEVSTVLVSLDVTEAVLWEAVDIGAHLIVSHHPLLFKAVKCLDDSQVSTRLARLASNMDLTLLAFHTNLDATQHGLNDALATALQIKNCRPLLPARDPQYPQAGLGRIGQLRKKMTLGALLAELSTSLKIENLRFAGSLLQEVQNIAVMTGSGAEYFSHAQQRGAEVLITGDLKYHQALDAVAQGMGIIDIGHFAGEIGMVALVAEKLKQWATKQKLPLEIFETQTQTDPIQYWHAPQKILPEAFKIA